MKWLNINSPATVCHSALDVENPVVRAESRFVCGYSGGNKNEIATLLLVARNDKKEKIIAMTNQRNTIEASCEVLTFPSPQVLSPKGRGKG